MSKGPGRLMRAIAELHKKHRTELPMPVLCALLFPGEPIAKKHKVSVARAVRSLQRLAGRDNRQGVSVTADRNVAAEAPTKTKISVSATLARTPPRASETLIADKLDETRVRPAATETLKPRARTMDLAALDAAGFGKPPASRPTPAPVEQPRRSIDLAELERLEALGERTRGEVVSRSQPATVKPRGRPRASRRGW